jgi:hypothetical protein
MSIILVQKHGLMMIVKFNRISQEISSRVKSMLTSERGESRRNNAG